MEESIDYFPAKRFNTTDEQNFCSTFECLSSELILNLFEYFNTKEILQSFFNLNSFITSCIFDRRQQFHLHLDHKIPFYPNYYSPNQVISLHIKHVIISIGIFVNLKSLSIVYSHEQEDECLNMVNEISKLSQLINFNLLLDGSEMSSIRHKIIEHALSHVSLRRIILSENQRRPYFYSWHRDSSLKLVFAAIKLVYVGWDFSDVKSDPLRYKLSKEMHLSLTTQYHIRHLDLNFKSWMFKSLVKFLSALPLLITLKIEGFCCCCQSIGWLNIDIWDQMLQNLQTLQRVAIEIRLAIPMRSKENSAKLFNEASAEKIQTCKRINLTVRPRIKKPNIGCVEISASFNMDMH